MGNNDSEEMRYPKRRHVYDIRVWDEENLLSEIILYSAHVNRIFVKRILSKALPKLWNGERHIKFIIEVRYKGKDWA